MKYYVFAMIALLAGCAFTASVQEDDEKKQYDLSIERMKS